MCLWAFHGILQTMNEYYVTQRSMTWMTWKKQISAFSVQFLAWKVYFCSSDVPETCFFGFLVQFYKKMQCFIDEYKHFSPMSYCLPQMAHCDIWLGVCSIIWLYSIVWLCKIPLLIILWTSIAIHRSAFDWRNEINDNAFYENKFSEIHCLSDHSPKLYSNSPYIF